MPVESPIEAGCPMPLTTDAFRVLCPRGEKGRLRDGLPPYESGLMARATKLWPKGRGRPARIRVPSRRRRARLARDESEVVEPGVRRRPPP